MEQGIREALEKAAPDVRVVTEYMDSKRYVDPEHLENLLRLLGHKYGVDHPALVIAVDDNAFNFMRIYGQQLFGDVPVVFCGVNDYPEGFAERHPNFTGVVEAIEVRSTLEEALVLFPRVRHVAVVVDRTPTGRSTIKQLNGLSADITERVNFLILDNLPMAELLRRVGSLPADSIVLLLNFNRDSEGKVFSHLETVRLLRRTAKVPIFGVWDFVMSEGAVGGKLTSGPGQGAAAADLALRILHGEKPRTLKVVKESPKVWMFDYNELMRFDLDQAKLPPGSRIINKPSSFYEVNKKIIWSLLAAVLFLAGATTLLALNIVLRRRVQMELRDTAEKLAALLDSLPIVPFFTSLERLGRFTYVSHTVTGITGFRPEDFLGDPDFWLKRIHPNDKNAVVEKLEGGAPEGGRLSYRFQCARGEYRWFNDTRRPVSQHEGGGRRVAGFWQDITAEMELRYEADRRLQQVIQADKLASLGELVAGVAHEIRNPNMFISTNAPLLRETWEMLQPLLKDAAADKVHDLDVDELTRDMEEMLEDILIGSERIDRVVRELKDFASSSENSPPQAVQLNEVVEKALTLVGAQVRRTFSCFTLDLAPDLPLVEGQPTKLEQVAANLVVNATHALRPGVEASLGIFTKRLDRHDAVVLQVEDNGRGIEPELRERIFEPFFTTRREEGGTGLGLSVSYRLVEDHGGAIFFVSRPGRGSRFTVALPLSAGKRLALRPSLLWLDRDARRLELVADMSREPAAPGILQLSDPERLAETLEDNPQAAAVCVAIKAFGTDVPDLLQMLAEFRPLVTRSVYAGSTPHRAAEAASGPLADAVLTGPLTLELLQGVMHLGGRNGL
jgi:PAS domain S-box-containing protein